jgi:hypothetical protein
MDLGIYVDTETKSQKTLYIKVKQGKFKYLKYYHVGGPVPE